MSTTPRCQIVVGLAALLLASGSAATASGASPKQRAEAAVERAVKGKTVDGKRVTQAGALCRRLSKRRYTCTWNGMAIADGSLCDGAARATVYRRSVDVRLRASRCDS